MVEGVSFVGEGYFSEFAMRISEALASSRTGISVLDLLDLVSPDGAEIVRAEEAAARREEKQRRSDSIRHMPNHGGYRIDDYGWDSGYRTPRVNCYPGMPVDFCAREAVFVSLQGKGARNLKGHNHYPFAQALEKLVQHLQGDCGGITQRAAFITDKWDYDTYSPWAGNIRKIMNAGVSIEFYLLCGKRQLARLNF